MTFVDRLRRLALAITAIEQIKSGGHPEALESASAAEMAVLADFARALQAVLDGIVADMRAHALASTAAWLGWLLEGVAGEVGTPAPDDVAEMILRIASLGARFGGIAPS